MTQPIEEKAQRGQSTIQFPYRDLDSSIAIARAIWDCGAVSGMAADQLAAAVGNNAGTGNFLGRLSAARMFGLIKNSAGRYQLTDLGYQLFDKDERQQKAARVQAFLSVPLYKKVYTEFRGRPLPPRPYGLERTLIDFGVAPKQGTHARLPFEKSAKSAGFFANGDDRLIEPIIASSNQGSLNVTLQPSTLSAQGETQDAPPPEPTIAETAGFAGRNIGRHPFIEGLLLELPKPGTEWSIAERANWLMAAARIFDILYQPKSQIGELMVSYWGQKDPNVIYKDR